MTITKSLIEKIQILDFSPRLEVINVFFEDYGPNRGKVTIEAEGDAWSYFWGGHGCSSIQKFFLKAGTDYLVCKLKLGIQATRDNMDAEAIQEKARKYILKSRKSGDLSKEKAREQWDSTEWITGGERMVDEEILSAIYGDEWYFDYPQEPNPEYQHLFSIVEAIRKSLIEQKV